MGHLNSLKTAGTMCNYLLLLGTRTMELGTRRARSESELSGRASTRLWRPPDAQQITRQRSGPPAMQRAYVRTRAARQHVCLDDQRDKNSLPYSPAAICTIAHVGLLFARLTSLYASVALDYSQNITWKDDFNRGVTVLLSPCAQPAKGATSPRVDAPL